MLVFAATLNDLQHCLSEAERQVKRGRPEFAVGWLEQAFDALEALEHPHAEQARYEALLERLA